MSKQSEAKEAQGYVEKAIPETCGNCNNYMSEIHVHENGYQEERHIKCGIGGFKVKKGGTCKTDFERKVTE